MIHILQYICDNRDCIAHIWRSTAQSLPKVMKYGISAVQKHTECWPIRHWASILEMVKPQGSGLQILQVTAQISNDQGVHYLRLLWSLWWDLMWVARFAIRAVSIATSQHNQNHSCVVPPYVKWLHVLITCPYCQKVRPESPSQLHSMTSTNSVFLSIGAFMFHFHLAV